MREAGAFRRTSTLLLATMIAIVASFVAVTIYTRVQLSHSAAILRLSDIAAPSVGYLAIARTAVYKLNSTIDRAVAVGAPLDAAQIAEQRTLLRASFDRYRALPPYPGEAVPQATAYRELDELDRALPRILALAPADARSRQTELTMRLDPLFDRIHEQLLGLLEINNGHLIHDAAGMKQSRRRDDAIAYGLDGIILVLAMLATVLVLRVARRYVALLERRSRELEYFAVQVAHDIFNPLTPVSLAIEAARNRGGGHALTQTLERGARGVERIRHAVESLRALALASTPTAAGERAWLAAALEQAIADSQAPARVRVEPFADRQLACSPALLSRLLRAFLDEALHGHDGLGVAVQVAARARQARVELTLAGGSFDAATTFVPHVRGPDSGYPGIDLEMATARQIVESHQGSVGVDGPVLWLALPMA
jgi:signal transduction histidine kinase